MNKSAQIVRMCVLTAAVGIVATLTACSSTSSAGSALSEAPTRRPDLTSNLLIEPGQTFVYAGEPGAGTYTAAVENVGPVEVFLAQRTGTTSTELGGLKPGASTFAAFQRGQAALFRNTSTQQARLTVRIWGDTNVGMRYEPGRSAKP